MEPEPFLNSTSAFLFIHLQPITLGLIIAIITTLLLLISSALISGSEVAYFSLKPHDLAEIRILNGRANLLVLENLNTPEYLLATILISNNFVNVGIVILSSFIITELLTFDDPNVVKFIFETVFITALILFFGEILPKIYAGRYPRKFARYMAYPLRVLIKIFKPISTLMVKSTNIVNKRLAKKMKSLSMDDISQALELTNDEVTEGKEILKGIVNFGNITVDEIMTARVDVEDIDIRSELSKIIAVIIETGYSRFPVYDDGPDDVKGILYVKDLLPYLGLDNTFQWQKLIRPAYYVPENKKLNDLLHEFKARKNHMAIVVDEYGGTAGIVTLEDILEEIVGDISDEMDEEEVNFVVLPDGDYLFEGKTLLKDFLRITGLPENTFNKVSGEAETIAGLLLELRGEIPMKHEIINYAGHQFTIMSADNRRIKKIKFSALKK